MEMAKLSKDKEKNADRLSLLSQCLTHLILQPKHLLVCYRTAIQHTFAAENFGACAELLEALMKKPLPDKSELERQLTTCDERKRTNKSTVLKQDDFFCFKVMNLPFLIFLQFSLLCFFRLIKLLKIKTMR